MNLKVKIDKLQNFEDLENYPQADSVGFKS